jgi:hypothetical protein
MSLKAFHIVFILASMLLAFGFGAWALHQYLEIDRQRVNLVMGILSLLTGFVLAGYGKYVLKKLKRVSYL